MTNSRCESTKAVLGRRPKFDRDYRCSLPLGHDGEHAQGSVRWTTAGSRPAPAPLFSTRLTMLKLLRVIGEDITEQDLIQRIDGGLRLDDVADRVVVALAELDNARINAENEAERLRP